MFLLFPAGLLFAAVLGFNLFGDGLRDALDPRTDRMVWAGGRAGRDDPVSAAPDRRCAGGDAAGDRGRLPGVLPAALRSGQAVLRQAVHPGPAGPGARTARLQPLGAGAVPAVPARDRARPQLRQRGGQRALPGALLRLLLPAGPSGHRADRRPVPGDPVDRGRCRAAVAGHRRAGRPGLRALPGQLAGPAGDRRRDGRRLGADLPGRAGRHPGLRVPLNVLPVNGYVAVHRRTRRSGRCT